MRQYGSGTQTIMRLSPTREQKYQSSGLKAREELNTAVESGEIFEQVLDRLGFRKTAEVNKWRENYKLGTIAISLDSVDELGTFAEIEIMTEEDDSDCLCKDRKNCKRVGDTGRADPRFVPGTAAL